MLAGYRLARLCEGLRGFKGVEGKDLRVRQKLPNFASVRLCAAGGPVARQAVRNATQAACGGCVRKTEKPPSPSLESAAFCLVNGCRNAKRRRDIAPRRADSK